MNSCVLKFKLTTLAREKMYQTKPTTHIKLLVDAILDDFDFKESRSDKLNALNQLIGVYKTLLSMRNFVDMSPFELEYWEGMIFSDLTELADELEIDLHDFI